MKDAGELERENAALRDRLSRLSQASLRINESLDFDTVLQRVLDSACSLTGARYGVITLLNESGRIQDFLYSGLTPEESRQFAEFPNGMLFFEYLSSIGEPLRLRDFHSYVRELGLPEFRPPMAVSSPLPLPGRAHPPPWGERRGLLRRREGAGVHPRRRGDPGDVRLPGGAGHRQRPQASRHSSPMEDALVGLLSTVSGLCPGTLLCRMRIEVH